MASSPLSPVARLPHSPLHRSQELHFLQSPSADDDGDYSHNLSEEEEEEEEQAMVGDEEEGFDDSFRHHNMSFVLPKTYRRLLSPLPRRRRAPERPSSPSGGIEYTDKGIISSTSGVSILALLSGQVRFSSSSSKRVMQQGDLVGDAWEYPGWGSVIQKTVQSDELPPAPAPRPPLDLPRSLSIAGNDMMASVLYTTGLVCAVCGQNAPFALFLAALALFPFKRIFKECGTALPLNGGVYVAMLNSTSKQTATIVCCCSLIDYCATAVVSAATATSYLQTAIGSGEEFPAQLVSIGILALFALLVVLGMKESANVALAIFAFHMATLAVLVAASLVSIARDGAATLSSNWASPLPISSSGGVGMDLYLGFSLSLLGLTGFETSANYIEECGPWEYEQSEPPSSDTNTSASTSTSTSTSSTPNNTSSSSSSSSGAGVGGGMLRRLSKSWSTPPRRRISVFERTIDWLWVLVISINPLVALCSLGVVDLPTIVSNPSNILSIVGQRAAGPWLSTLVAVDAVVVLAGGVLTAYLGVTGLICQLAADRCLPAVLLQRNSQFGSNHWIILFFLVLCSSLYGVTAGDVSILSGVFSIAFLVVLLSFAASNAKLKFSRPRLPRAVTSSWLGVALGFGAMLVGLMGVVAYNPVLAGYFLMYLAFFATVTILTFKRVAVVKLLLFACRLSPTLKLHFEARLCDTLKKMKKHTVLFFTKTSELHCLNKAILYARDNEFCDRLLIAHVYQQHGLGSRTPSCSALNGPFSSSSSSSSSGVLGCMGTSDKAAAAASSDERRTPSTAHSSGSDPEGSCSGSGPAAPPPHDGAAEAPSLGRRQESINQRLSSLRENLKVLDHVYPKMKVDLLLISSDDGFCPRLTRQLSQDLGIPPSFMFIRCPGENLKFGIAEFGGVRTIMR